MFLQAHNALACDQQAALLAAHGQRTPAAQKPSPFSRNSRTRRAGSAASAPARRTPSVPRRTQLLAEGLCRDVDWEAADQKPDRMSEAHRVTSFLSALLENTVSFVHSVL